MSNGNQRGLPSIRAGLFTAAVLYYNRPSTKRAIRESVFIRAAVRKIECPAARGDENTIRGLRPLARIGQSMPRNFFNDFVNKSRLCEKLHGISRLGHIPHSQMRPGLATFQLSLCADLRSLGLDSFEPCQPFPDVGLHTVSTPGWYRIFECPRISPLIKKCPNGSGIQ